MGLCHFEQQSQRMGDQAEVTLLQLGEPTGHQHNVLRREKKFIYSHVPLGDAGYVADPRAASLASQVVPL